MTLVYFAWLPFNSHDIVVDGDDEPAMHGHENDVISQ